MYFTLHVRNNTFYGIEMIVPKFLYFFLSVYSAKYHKDTHSWYHPGRGSRWNTESCWVSSAWFRDSIFVFRWIGRPDLHALCISRNRVCDIQMLAYYVVLRGIGFERQRLFAGSGTTKTSAPSGPWLPEQYAGDPGENALWPFYVPATTVTPECRKLSASSGWGLTSVLTDLGYPWPLLSLYFLVLFLLEVLQWLSGFSHTALGFPLAQHYIVDWKW